MYLLQSKSEDTKFSVVAAFDRSDKEWTFMGGFALPQLKALSRVIKNFISSQPRPALPDLTKFTDRDLAEAYITLRDRKKESSKVAAKVEAGFNDALDQIGVVFLTRLNERGTKSTSIEGVGSVTKKMKVQPSSGDWKLTYNFLIDEAIRLRSENKDATEIFAYLQKRLTIKPINDYIAAHDGDVPPGVNVLKTYTVGVRRAGDKGDDDDE